MRQRFTHELKRDIVQLCDTFHIDCGPSLSLWTKNLPLLARFKKLAELNLLDEKCCFHSCDGPQFQCFEFVHIPLEVMQCVSKMIAQSLRLNFEQRLNNDYTSGQLTVLKPFRYLDDNVIALPSRPFVS